MKYFKQDKKMEDNISTMVEKTINDNFEKLEVSFQQGGEEGDKCGGVSNTNPTRMQMIELLERIMTNARVKEKTEKCRRLLALGATDAAKKCKLFEQDSFLTAILVEGGIKAEHCVKCNNLVIGDWDGQSLEEVERCRELLRKDEHVLMFYQTISGHGFHILVPVEGVTDEKSHKIAWQQVNDYYDRVLGLPHDASCNDFARKSILAHDPNAFFNPNAIPIYIDYYQLVTDKKRGRPLKDVHHKLKEVEKHMREYMKNRCKVEYVEGSRNDYIFKASCQFNRYGVDKEEVLEYFYENAKDLSSREIEQAVNSAYNRFPQQHGTLSPFNHKERKQAKAESKGLDLQEIEDYMRTFAEYRHNIITQRYEIKWMDETEWIEVTDDIFNDIWRMVCKNVRQVPDKIIRNIIESSFSKPYNPFIQSYESLKPWDGKTDYFDILAGKIHLQPTSGTHYPLRDALEKWFTATTATHCDPNAYNKKALALVGPQNTLKTTFCRLMSLPAWGKHGVYVKNNFREFSRDDRLIMTQAPIFVMDEVSHLKPQTLDELKSLTSMTTINERALYARHSDSRHRISSFCLTSNNINFLTDSTGNSRFLTYEVCYIDNPYDFPPELWEGVWAQAYHKYKSGYKYWFSPEEDALIEKQNEYFTLPSTEEELIRTYYQIPQPGEPYKLLSGAEIIGHLQWVYKGPINKTELLQALRKLGYQEKRTSQKRGYMVKEIPLEDIEKRQTSSDWSHLPPSEDTAQAEEQATLF